MENNFVIRTRRLHSLIGVVLGAGLLFVTVDAHTVQMLGASSAKPWSPVWLIVGGLGALAFFGAGRSLLRPMTLLEADPRGVTVYSGVSASSWNQKTKSWDKTRRRGDPCLIPWSAIREIREGTVVTPVDPRTGKATGVTLGGTITGRGRERRHIARTVDILCDRSVKLVGFETTGFSITWNGYEEGDLVGMSKAERASLKPEDFMSGFMLGCTGMNVRGQVAVETLKAMQARHSQSQVH